MCERFGDQVQVTWGDLRRPADLADVVRGQDAAIHLAFIIPKSSATGVDIDKEPAWAREINVGGTRNLLQAMAAQPQPPKILFASSIAVYGPTHDLTPPRTASDPLNPIDHYARHKVECERMVRASGLAWSIFRLAAAIPFRFRFDPGLFDVPLDVRMEFVHPQDVALALARGVGDQAIWGRVLLIGGGRRCQYRFREIARRILDAVGVGMLPDQAFGPGPFYTDWLDTAESQQLLGYQCCDLGDYVAEMKARLGLRRYLARAFRPLVRRWLLSRSPYYREARTGAASARSGKQAFKEAFS
jgi:nucleoside-diphosphate-sugar epimerase